MFELTVGFRFGHGTPKNLDKLPDWIAAQTNDDGSATLKINRPKTYELVMECQKLATEHAYSLSNSNRRIAGENVLMCGTLNTIYQHIADQVDEELREISYRVSEGKYKLSASCLNESPNGKRFSHALPSEKQVYAYPSWAQTDRRYSASEMANLIREKVESAAMGKPVPSVV
jgi:hypothetical protein